MAINGVNFTAGGNAYSIKISTNAICRIEEITGKSLTEIIAAFDEGLVSVGMIRAIFAASVLPRVSEDAAGDMIDDLTLARAGELIGQAFQSAFPESDGTANPPKATAA